MTSENQLPIIFRPLIDLLRSGDYQNAGALIKNLVSEDGNHLPHLIKLGTLYAQQNIFDIAKFIFEALLKSSPSDDRVFYNLSLIYSIQKKYDLALEAINQSLIHKPYDVYSLINKSAILNDLGNYNDALICSAEAIKLKPDSPHAWLNNGVALKNLLRLEEAIRSYDTVLEIDENFYSALLNKSAALIQLKEYEEAVHCCNLALKSNAKSPEILFNKGNALSSIRQYEDAVACFHAIIEIDKNQCSAWLNLAITKGLQGKHSEALSCFDQAISINPDYAEAYANKGNTLAELRRYPEALSCFDQAIAINPNYAEAYANKGNTLAELQHYSEALSCFDQAIAINPNYAEAYANKGSVFYSQRQYRDALPYFNKAYELNDSIDYLLGDIVNTKLQLGDWGNITPLLEKLYSQIEGNQRCITPFSLLSALDSPEMQLKCGAIHTKDKYPNTSTNISIQNINKKRKIKVGYFSADFRTHPVSFLTAELFELHDRSKFEIFGFSLKNPIGDDPVRTRLLNAFDYFHDVSSTSDIEIAKLARSLEIDIAIDLGGHTEHGRMGIFSHRAAPIQINYLGFPGTTGASFFDYIIADQIVIPEDSQRFYSEKVIYLPDCFQANDSKRIVSPRNFSRSELGLPEDGVILCCFNSNYKINRQVFHSWMSILKNTSNSYLWLLASNSSIENNLLQYAHAHGVSKNRLFFGGWLPSAEYLARYRSADLFLDTAPFNAGTTANDALWAGLPVLTLAGQSFASRMAASLLHAIDLPELVTYTHSEYESRAIELCNNQSKLSSIKLKLGQNKKFSPLFNSKLFTRNLENAYRIALDRTLAGENLKPIYT